MPTLPSYAPWPSPPGSFTNFITCTVEQQLEGWISNRWTKSANWTSLATKLIYLMILFNLFFYWQMKAAWTSIIETNKMLSQELPEEGKKILQTTESRVACVNILRSHSFQGKLRQPQPVMVMSETCVWQNKETKSFLGPCSRWHVSMSKT